MWTWMAQYSFFLELGIALGFFFVGVAIYFVAKPEILELKFANWAFLTWTAQWLASTIKYLLLVNYPDRPALAYGFSDVQDILVLAVALALLTGNDFKLRDFVAIPGLVFVFLLLWNLGLNPGAEILPPVWRHILWRAPSETIAFLSLALVGFASFIRYKAYGSPLLIVAVLYDMILNASYGGRLMAAQNIPDAALVVMALNPALVLVEVLLGVFFYILFFVKLPDYPTAVPPLSAQVDRDIRIKFRKAAKWILGSIVVPLLMMFIASYFGK